MGPQTLAEILATRRVQIAAFAAAFAPLYLHMFLIFAVPLSVGEIRHVLRGPSYHARTDAVPRFLRGCLREATKVSHKHRP